jgi:UDPglucose 6-dehydrogenase
MTKHALNSFLALQVVYTNELARLCEKLGADAKEVERGLRSDPRIGERAYVSPGPPLAGGTLARDVKILSDLSAARGLNSPLVEAITSSNRLHQAWTRDRLLELLDGVRSPRVALLGLTYKPGTNTLRRSSSVEIGQWLLEQGAEVVAFDPAVGSLPTQLAAIHTAPSLEEALERADAAVIATPWPEFSSLTADTLVNRMRVPRVVDQAGFLGHLGDDPRVIYVRVGRPVRSASTA